MLFEKNMDITQLQFYINIIVRCLVIVDLISREFQILEVNCWTRTPIPAHIGTFVVPLSAYVLIENHIKGVRWTSLDKEAVRWIEYIWNFIIAE